jgi:ubiquinone biosynthesis protein UbiJ
LMFEAASALAARSVMERLVLMINHVIGAEPVACERLRPHAGRSVRFRFEGWPRLLPALPPTVFRVTPAGLLEWSPDDPLVGLDDLVISVDASNPARAALRALGGTRPTISIAGDAAFASDVNWLFDNLRWDIEDDVARLIGDAPARQLGRLASAVGGALRKAAQTLGRTGRVEEPGGPPV